MAKKQVIQHHHLSHDPEIVVDLWKGEHRIATLMQLYTRKKVSTGFITWLEYFVAVNRNRATEAKHGDNNEEEKAIKESTGTSNQ